jgi:hypothetical protein
MLFKYLFQGDKYINYCYSLPGVGKVNSILLCEGSATSSYCNYFYLAYGSSFCGVLWVDDIFTLHCSFSALCYALLLIGFLATCDFNIHFLYSLLNTKLCGFKFETEVTTVGNCNCLIYLFEEKLIPFI